MYLHSKINFLGQGFQNLEHEQDTQANTTELPERLI